MSVRWPLVLAVLGLVGAAPRLEAQMRPPGGARGSRPAGPRAGPHRPPTTRQPFNPAGTRPPFVGPKFHRPMPFRSSIFGLVLFDPYWWSAPEIADEQFVPAPIPFGSPPPTGGVQLDVEPRRALVYVDGILAGAVDRFSGYYQHLDATAGSHVIDLVAPGYEPLTIVVTVVPNQTTTYRGSLNRAWRH